MKISDFENIRKKKFPIYITFLSLSMLMILTAIVILIFLNLNLLWWQFLIIAVIAIVIIFMLIIVADQVEKRYLKKYNPLFYNEFVVPIIKNIFQESLIEKEEILDLSNIKLIGKSHKYKVLNQIHTANYSIYEISVLQDFRFRGFVIKKELKDFHDSLIMTNYNYYFKPKINEYKILTGINNFDNKYLLYSSNPNYLMKEELALALFKRLSNFKNIGLTIENNQVYFVLGVFAQEVNLGLSITEEMNDDYLKKIREFIQKLKSIAEFNPNI